METILTVNRTTKAATDGSGNSWTPPPLIYGESLTIGIYLQENANGGVIDSTITPTGSTASIGPIDGRPTSGKFCLQMGGGAQTDANTTTELSYNSPPADAQAAINAIESSVAAYGTCAARFANGSWLLRFAGTVQPIVKCVNNTLIPISYGRVSATQIDGQWEIELRLTQLPVAFSDASALVLPPPPLATEITEGGSSATNTWNEVQSLYIRPDFKGAYAIQIGGTGQTQLLSNADTPATIQAALVAEYGANFNVTLPLNWTIYVEFTGIYAGEAVSLMTILPQAQPIGALTFTLQLTRYELLSLFRTQSTVTLPLQAQFSYLDANNVPQTEVALAQMVTIQLGNIFPDLASVPSQDWLRPPSPKTYVPQSSTTVVLAGQFAYAVVGDGETTSFDVTFGLGSDKVFTFVRQASTPGAQLIEGTDYSVEYDSENDVTVTALKGAPALNAWMIIVQYAQTVAQFAAGLTVTTGQVTGLDALLADLSSAVAALQALVPSGGLFAPTTPGGTTQTITIPDNYLVFPSKRLPASFLASSLDGGNPNSAAALALPRPPALLSAINTDTATAFSSGTLPASPGSLTVWMNTGSGAVFVPGARGIASFNCPVSGYIGWDGRQWYQLTQGSGPNTYFPTAFEQVLVPTLTFDAALWQPKQAFTLQFTLAVQTFRATSNYQWDLVIETGTAPSDASPATTTENLEDIVWDAVPLLTQRLVVTPLQQSWTFGCQISRSATNVMTAMKLLQSAWSEADSSPSSPSFVLRVRLVNGDTQDPDASTAVGYVWAHLSQGSATI